MAKYTVCYRCPKRTVGCLITCKDRKDEIAAEKAEKEKQALIRRETAYTIGKERSLYRYWYRRKLY